MKMRQFNRCAGGVLCGIGLLILLFFVLPVRVLVIIGAAALLFIGWALLRCR